MKNTLRGTRLVAVGLIAACTAITSAVATSSAASASPSAGTSTNAPATSAAHSTTAAAVSSPAQRGAAQGAPGLAQLVLLRQRAQLAARAKLARTGVITGSVAGFDGQFVAGACVTAVGQAGSVTAAAAPDGTFRLAGLAAGSYVLEYRGCSASGRYLTTWSGGAGSQSAAARVQVGPGRVRHVPVMMLRPADPLAAIAAGQASFRHALAASGGRLTAAAAAKTGQISGRVTGKGKPVRGVCVQVLPAGRSGQGFGAITGKHGTYSVRNIKPGRYDVIFASLDCQSSGKWLPQVYRNDNQPFAEFNGSGATVLKVRAGRKIAGINASLRLGGQISGTVTSRSGRKLGNICVVTFGSVPGGFFGIATATSANGSYHLGPLFPGKYPVQFAASGCGSPAANYTPATHKAVKIGYGQHLTVNAALAPGASITGIVTLGSSSGMPLRGICVAASNPTGTVNVFTSTDRNGRYRVIGLTGGRYQLQFSPGCNNQGNYTSIVVTAHTKAGHPTTGVNAVLQVGGQISGTVTDSHGNPVSGICIQLDGKNSDTANVPGSTAANGSYAITSLSAGTYEVGFSGGCGNSGDYAPTWYQNQSDESLATPIKLSAGGTATANQQMLPGAAISGKVTDASGRPLSGICVDAATQTQAQLGPVFMGIAFTQHGKYTITGLAPGQYLIDFGCGVGSKYADQWFPKAPSAESADQISAGPGRTSGINAVLQLGGSIRGVVTNKAGHPLAGICVTATNASGLTLQATDIGEFGQPATGARGTYRISGLSPGRYDVGVQLVLRRRRRGMRSSGTAVPPRSSPRRS